jgi:TrmH family RNA methyltransferase
MPEIRVVIVGPKYEGNVGAIARSMANFDIKELYLVNPCELGDDAYRRSKHGADILDNAVMVNTLEEATQDCFMVVGTSGVVTSGDRNYTRVPMPVREFAEHCRGYTEKIAVVFGREDIGLLQDELNYCDVLITIPASEEYPILNLSHATHTVLYEFFMAMHTEPRRPEPADKREKELMFAYFGDLLDAIDYPRERRSNTSVMFRRMMGRAIPTKYEYNTLMGVFGDAAKYLKYGKSWEKDKKN